MQVFKVCVIPAFPTDRDSQHRRVSLLCLPASNRSPPFEKVALHPHATGDIFRRSKGRLHPSTSLSPLFSSLSRLSDTPGRFAGNDIVDGRFAVQALN